MAKMQQALKRSKNDRRSELQREALRRLEERIKMELEKEEEEWLSRIEAIKEGRAPSAPLQAKEQVRFAGFSAIMATTRSTDPGNR
jgi:Arc/MetJ-type ribon-helix-helix transcriptional regulator